MTPADVDAPYGGAVRARRHALRRAASLIRRCLRHLRAGEAPPADLVAALYLSRLTRPLIWGALLWWRRDPPKFYKILFCSYRLEPAGHAAAAREAGALARLLHSRVLYGAQLFLLNRAQRYDQTVEAIAAHPPRYPDHPAITPAKIDALFHEGDLEATVETLETSRVDDQTLRMTGPFGLASVAAACCKRWDLVHSYFARDLALSLVQEKETTFPTVWHDVEAATLELLRRDDARRASPPPGERPFRTLDEDLREGRVGVLYHNMPHMLGHALHEPYFFMALNRDRYDSFYLVGGLRQQFQPGPGAAMQIVNQYCRYVETNEPLFHRLAHMDLGVHAGSSIGLHAQHNWSLTRDMVLRSRDPHDRFQAYEWVMSLPDSILTDGEAFCARHGIDLRSPVVVVHVRYDGYHAIRRQALRSADIRTYTTAIQWLLDLGYVVVRLGDAKMPRLELAHPCYLEIPFKEGYDAALDSFFVSKARFLISSPSGPLCYAWALGKPVLCVNAIQNYLHFSSAHEMECFKVYVERSSGRELSMQEALERRLFHYIHKPELDRAGYDVRDATSDEILQSVKDMEAWVANPDIALTDRQARFRATVDDIADRLLVDPDVRPPIADFLGMSMPGFRISPTVAEIRGDFGE